jgi:RNA polymerase sigma-70 factor (ECF subfamily)
MTTQEINWVEALRSANQKEQADAMNLLRGVLLQGLCIALGDRADVSEAHLEDFAQEGLLRILDKLDQFQGRSLFTTWAQSVALNTAFSELRRKRWKDVSLDALMEQGGHLAEPSILPDDALGSHEDQSHLLSVMRKAIAEELTPKQRAAIMAELGGMPFDQVCSLLGTSRNAGYKLLHDARRALKRHLEEAGITGYDIQLAFTT